MKHLSWLVFAPLLVAPLQAQQRTRSPHGDLRMECMTCHISSGWTPVRVTKAFDHSKFDFALTGAHATTTCRACHQPLDFKGAKTTCASCHADKHRGELGANCASCHTTRGFVDRELMVRAHQLTRFPLQGGHLGVECSSCHKAAGQGGLQFVGTQRECVSCHRPDFNAAPNHVAGNFPTTCAGCHNQAVWSRVVGGGSSHPTNPIALTGVHGASQCTDCHVSGQPYAAVQRTCDGCHHTDYVGTTNPNHIGAGYSTDCTSCHQPVANWGGATMNHPTSPLALTGQHAIPPRACVDCHTSTTYSSVAQTCDGCHHADYVGVTDPNHTAVGMTAFAAANCTNCHSPTKSSWSGPTWAHMTIVNPQRVRLPHEGASCADCHQNSTNYTIKSCAKSGCHSNVNGPN